MLAFGSLIASMWILFGGYVAKGKRKHWAQSFQWNMGFCFKVGYFRIVFFHKMGYTWGLPSPISGWFLYYMFGIPSVFSSSRA
jgi:hypothetical protein